MNPRHALAALLGGSLLAFAGCGGSATPAAGNAAATSSTTSGSTPAPGPGTAPPSPQGLSGGDFCTQLRALVRWQLDNGAQLDAPAFLAENERRYTALEKVAPTEFHDTMAFFARYAGDPPAKAAQAPGFADQARKVTEAAQACGIDPTHP